MLTMQVVTQEEMAAKRFMVGMSQTPDVAAAAFELHARLMWFRCHDMYTDSQQVRKKDPCVCARRVVLTTVLTGAADHYVPGFAV